MHSFKRQLPTTIAVDVGSGQHGRPPMACIYACICVKNWADRGAGVCIISFVIYSVEGLLN